MKLLIALSLGGLVVAQQTSLDLTYLLNFGILGLITILWITGFLVPGKTHDATIKQLTEENVALKAEIRELHREDRTQLIPVLSSVNAILARVIEHLELGGRT